MDAIERRAFVKGAGLGALAFTVGGAQVLLTPAQAFADNVPLHTLKPDEATTLEAMGETLVPRTRSSHDFPAGRVANFGSEGGTGIIELLVSFRFRSSLRARCK